MSCSADSLHGIVHLTGPIQPLELEGIRLLDYFPLSFSFRSHSTLPIILGRNRIEGNMEDSCFYNGKRYNLLDIQICAPLHKGYKLPTENQTPVAECILTYKPAAIDSPVSAILLCLPIYLGGSAYDGYLSQIVTDSDITCGYENESGKEYEGPDQKTIKDVSLSKCIKSCCDDNQCLAYTFGRGTCHIKHTIPNLLASDNSSTISGKINRGKGMAASCSSSSSSSSSIKKTTETIESFFYKKDGSSDHTVLSYQACFETVDKNVQLNNKYSIHVTYFTSGIRMNPKIYEDLLLRLQGSLIPYQFPPVLRNFDKTLLRYRMENGKKIPTEASFAGELYVTQITSCSKEFKNFFKYFILPNRANTIVAPKTNDPTSARNCKRYTTEQYKCVPFNELTDLSGNVVIPGNVTLEDIRKAQKENQNNKSLTSTGDTSTVSTAKIEAIVGSSIGGAIFIFLLYRAYSYFFDPPVVKINPNPK
jgi:hypothetical protein